MTQEIRSIRHASPRTPLLLPAALLLLAAGCNGLRLAPDETQKQNAWLHNRTATVAAQAAREEGSSQQLQALTKLSELQSRSFTAYCGLPKEYPQAETVDDILSESSVQIATAALARSAERPDPWEVADSALDIGIGVSALFGGVLGARAVRLLQEARDKSKALREIIQGNERFKSQHAGQVAAFKAAQENQSPETRRLVTTMKG
ncbi:MAG TPA: hypothetical protein VLI39_03095 [Sedimentisphaerales bacterium]|nr:hypothetical protein [Sedimentisphaerales bacterium]